MQDTEPLESRMDGKQYTASHLAATLRRMLWREHLGLLPAQSLDGSDDPNAQPPNDSPNFWHEGDEYDELVADPLGDKVWDLWTKQADTNTQVFRDLFHADPDDSIRNFDDYEKFLPKESGKKQGHLFDPSQPVDEIRKQLDKIRVRPFHLPDLPVCFWLLTFLRLGPPGLVPVTVPGGCESDVGARVGCQCLYREYLHLIACCIITIISSYNWPVFWTATSPGRT